MSDEAKVGIVAIVGVAITISMVAWSTAWYYRGTAVKAMECGYEQKVVGANTIWVKAQ